VRKLLLKGRGSVCERHLWLCRYGIHTRPGSLTSMCHLYRPCRPNVLLFLMLGGFVCLLGCFGSLQGRRLGHLLGMDALCFIPLSLSLGTLLYLLSCPQLFQAGCFFPRSCLGRLAVRPSSRSTSFLLFESCLSMRCCSFTRCVISFAIFNCSIAMVY
jgi:hypothetical protein